MLVVLAGIALQGADAAAPVPSNVADASEAKTSLADAWSSLKDSLSAGEEAASAGDALTYVAEARETYERNFMGAATELDPESHRIITDALASAEAAHLSGDVAQAKLERQAVDKTIYTIAYLKIEQALHTGDAKAFDAWFEVMEKKFVLSEKRPGLSQMAQEASADPSGIPGHSDQIRQGLLEIFKLKTLEEPEEAIFALEEGDVAGAQKFAYEGYYYYRTLHPAVEERLGQQKAGKLLSEMEGIITVTMSDTSPYEMKHEVERRLGLITAIVTEYEFGAADMSEIGMALVGIKNRLGMIEVEYLDAVSDGTIVDQKEYDETIAFHGKVTRIFDDNRDALAGLSEHHTETLDEHLAELGKIVHSKGSTAEASILVARSLNSVTALQDLSGGEVQDDLLAYFDEIERLLGEAKVSYRNGQADLAFRQVSEAYLDNYEFIEAPLGEVDMDLMLKIETDMREDLRTMIRDGVPADEVDAQIGMILEDLDVGKQAIPEFGTVALAVLAVAIASITVASSRFRTSMAYRA